jgi:hypothetical protein
MTFVHPLCHASRSPQTGRGGSEEFPRTAGDDEERGRDSGPLIPDRELGVVWQTTDMSV